MNSSVTVRLLLIVIPLILLCGRSEAQSQWKDFEGGNQVVFEIESSGSKSIDKKNILIISKILKERMNALGVKSRIIKLDGDGRLMVQLSKVKNPTLLIRLLSKSFLLEFKVVDDDSPLMTELNAAPSVDDANRVLKRYASKIPKTDNLLFGVVRDKETGMARKTAYLVKKQTLMIGASLTQVKAEIDARTNEPYISIGFDTAGAKQFEQLTETYRGKRLAIILDDEVYAAPRITEKVTGGIAQISGPLSIEESKDLAIVLKAGCYPVKTRLIESKVLTRAMWLEEGNN